ncbi:MAG TPA: c-type cytochrome [Bryobacteraceae bacterium]|nr:c-type cytochrome [Bryobacteraceae bacterium]
MKMLGAYLLAAVGFAKAASLLQEAPPRTASISNPLEGQENARRAGAKLFARECAPCHGENAVGGLGKAPPLRQAEVYRAAPGALFWILRNGSLHRGMPSFAHLPEAQRWQIITWLKAQKPT